MVGRKVGHWAAKMVGSWAVLMADHLVRQRVDSLEE